MLPAIQTFKERYGDLRFFMAPMAGITDLVFRRLIREMGAQVVISELISAEGLIRGGQRTRELMAFDEAERPVGIQLFGNSVPSLTQAAHMVQEEGADFVDLNFGCPVKKIVCDGAGASWLKEPERLRELLGSIRQAIRIPLTIKIRTGWDQDSRNAEEIVKIAADTGVSWVAIHGRTRAQGYEGSADWEFIKQVSENSSIPIIGNGDILNAEQAWNRLNRGYCHGVMVGRGALKNPWIFRDLLKLPVHERDFLSLIERHFSLALEKKERRRAFLSLKKFMGWYASGFPGSSQFRHRIFSTLDVNELKQMTFEYFSQLNYQDLSIQSDAFLMGGHG